MRVREKVVEDAGVEHRLALELLAEVVADDRLAVLLPFGEVQGDLRRVELDLAALRVRLNTPSVRDVRRGVAVDEAAGPGGDGVERPLDQALQSSEHTLDGERPLADATEKVVLTASQDAQLLVRDNIGRHDKTPSLMPLAC